MAKLMGTTEESTSGVTDHRRIHATSRGEQYSDLFFWQAECQKQVEDESLQGEGWIHEGVDELDLPTVCQQTASESENHLLIHEGWSDRHQGVCPTLRDSVSGSVRFGTEEKQTISLTLC